MTDESVANEEDRCTICLGPKIDPVYLSCLHIYCRQCITKSINSRGVTNLDEHVRMQLDNMEPISCPQCRNVVYKRRGQKLVLPNAIPCFFCGTLISKIVRFPCCGFQNTDTCLKCECCEDTGATVTCPACQEEISANAVQTLSLCLFCKEFKLERNSTCECQGPLHDGDNLQQLVSMISWLQQEHQHAFVAQNIAVPDNNQHIANIRVTSYLPLERWAKKAWDTFLAICAFLFVIYCVWLYIIVPTLTTVQYVTDKVQDVTLWMRGTRPYSAKECDFDRYSGVWVADTLGNINPYICPRGVWIPPRSRSYWTRTVQTEKHSTMFDSSSSPEKLKSKESFHHDDGFSGRVWNEEQFHFKNSIKKRPSKQRPTGPNAVKKKRPVYQKECYPSAVWLITPEGAIHTKTCEDVITGYQLVTEIL